MKPFWPEKSFALFKHILWASRLLSGKEVLCQRRGHKRCRYDPWLWKIQWQPVPVFLPEKFHGQRNLEGYSPWGHRVRHDWATEHTHTCSITVLGKNLCRVHCFKLGRIWWSHSITQNSLINSAHMCIKKKTHSIKSMIWWNNAQTEKYIV